MQTNTLPLKDIHVREGFNPRTKMDAQALKDLSASIATRGLIQALTVAKDEKLGWVLIDGHRRFRAAQAAGLDQVPVIVRDSADEGEHLIDAVVANTKREDMSLMDEAQACSNLKLRGYSEKEIAVQLSMAPSAVKLRLALVDLDPLIQTLVTKGQLTAGHVAVIADAAKLSNPLACGLAAKVAQAGISPTELKQNPLACLTKSEPDLGVWVVGRYGGLQISDIPKTAKLEGLVKQVETLKGYELTSLQLEEYVVDQGVQAGYVWRPSVKTEDATQQVPYAIVHKQWLIEQVELQLVREAKAAEAAAAKRLQHADAKVDVKRGIEVQEDGSVRHLSDAEKKAARKQEKEAVTEARTKAYAANNRLGAHIMRELQPVELDRDTALDLAALVLRTDARPVGARGLGLCLDRYATEKYAKGGTLASRTFDTEKAADDVFGFLAAGQTPGEVLARLAAVLEMAQRSDLEALAESKRPKDGWWNSSAYSSAIKRLVSRARPDNSRPTIGRPIIDAEADLVARRRMTDAGVPVTHDAGENKETP